MPRRLDSGARRLAALLLALPFGCTATAPAPPPRVAAAPRTPRPAPPPADCAGRTPLYADGRLERTLCLEDASRPGLTLLDLSDDWLPYLFTEDETLGAAGRQTHRERLVALANERFGRGPEWDIVRDDRYLELYGISPSFAVLRARLGEERRHACHQEVDDTALRAQGPAARLGPALRAAQAHLRCEGLLGRYAAGKLDGPTREALGRYQRKHGIVSDRPFDQATRQALLTDSRELDFRAVLRALRARVADATGLIEDGSAAGQSTTVLGRSIDLGPPCEGDALPGAAPDLVSPATEAAARALGWTGPDELVASFVAGLPKQVLVRLPAPPPHHGPRMELRAVIDRGDVWYDYPFRQRGAQAAQPVERRPMMILYTRHAGRDIPLVRWPTTIGGWQVERLPGGSLAYRYKNSDTGPRVFRDVIATPAWLAPAGIPEKELVRRGAGGWVARSEVIGPGYRSAYGLVMLMLHSPRGPNDEGEDAPTYADSTLRVHGSANYASILRGTSHGCNRLYNQLAIRLAGFLLQHRPFVRHGDLRTSYQRRMYWRDRTIELGVSSRGHRYELTPPVPVEVLPGRVRGATQAPIVRPMPVPRDVVAQYRRW